MCQTTAWLFRLTLPESFLLFTFVGTLGSYSLHWFLTDSSADYTRRGRWNYQYRSILASLFIGAALTGVWMLWYLRVYLIELLPVVLITFLYSAPKIDSPPFRAIRRIAILKSLYLTFVWTYVTVVLPFLVVSPLQRPTGFLMALWFLNRFLLIYSIALWFDYRDRDVDRQSRWLTLASRLTDAQLYRFFYSVVFFFGLTLVALYQHGFTVWNVLCIGLPMCLLTLLAQRLLRKASDYLYYIGVDGLLMLSGILLAVTPV
ncbi:hypothetical protein GCM10027185_33300 [Spirosoma pulveris]